MKPCPFYRQNGVTHLSVFAETPVSYSEDIFVEFQIQFIYIYLHVKHIAEIHTLIFYFKRDEKSLSLNEFMVSIQVSYVFYSPKNHIEISVLHVLY